MIRAKFPKSLVKEVEVVVDQPVIVDELIPVSKFETETPSTEGRPTLMGSYCRSKPNSILKLYHCIVRIFRCRVVCHRMLM